MVIDTPSPPGMTKAAKTKKPKMMPRFHLRRFAAGSTPTWLSMTTSSGSSKLTPKISSSAMRNPKYWSGESATVTTPALKPSSTCRPLATT